jgi:hypothetical protein
LKEHSREVLQKWSHQKNLTKNLKRRRKREKNDR